MQSDSFTILEFGQKHSMSRSTVQRGIASGDIPTIRIGRSLRIPAWFVEDLVRAPGQLPTFLGGKK
jgi:excisionase family DNA binding protein